MKKLLLLILILPFIFSCSSDDNEPIDLEKYPLYNTKWVSQLKTTSYYTFNKEDGIAHATLIINDKEIISKEVFSYEYENQNISLFFNSPKDTLRAIIQKDTMYFSRSHEGAIVYKYCKVED